MECAEVNALKAMLPSLDRDTQKETKIPHGGIDLGNGYILLCAKDTCARDISHSQVVTLRQYLSSNTACNLDDVPDGWKVRMVKWSRLRLPNGQVM